MGRRIHTKKLLVEGRQEQRVIPFLMEANGVHWPNDKNDAPVWIEEFEGIDNLLKAGVIEAELKASGVEMVGICVDANGDIQQRWEAIRVRCLASFPNLPKDWPGRSIVEVSPDGLKLGVWIMPDNKTSGMLESFLQFLAPSETEDILTLAKESCAAAKASGAKFKDVHLAKAEIYTWLAWQDEPGRQLHEAVSERILEPTSPQASEFVSWFRELFEV